MNTFGIGDEMVPANSIREGLHVAETVRKCRDRLALKDQLRRITHGHDFNYDMECSHCGLKQLDYYAHFYSSLEACRAIKGEDQ